MRAWLWRYGDRLLFVAITGAGAAAIERIDGPRPAAWFAAYAVLLWVVLHADAPG